MRRVCMGRDDLARGYLDTSVFFAWTEVDVAAQGDDEPDEAFDVRLAASGLEPDFVRERAGGIEIFTEARTGRDLTGMRKARLEEEAARRRLTA